MAEQGEAPYYKAVNELVELWENNPYFQKPCSRSYLVIIAQDFVRRAQSWDWPEISESLYQIKGVGRKIEENVDLSDFND